jgi:hypothetical protein
MKIELKSLRCIEKNCILDPFICIKNEINKYPANIIKEFIRLFPTKAYRHCIKHTVLYKFKQQTPTNLTMGCFWSYYDVESFLSINQVNIWIEDSQEFWNRWNRFKKLAAFWGDSNENTI